MIPDIGDADGDRDARQAYAVIERLHPDAGYRMTIGRAGDCHHSVGAGISSDCDSPIIGRECQLDMNHGWERQ